jgi:cysteinyl-tRNA synthetase
MITLYNTLSRKKEVFEPMDGKTVRMYSCGPTVYNYAHIGNMRTYIFMDLVRRAFRYEGYKIKGVMNITDVGHMTSDADEGEDKLEKASREEKKSPWEIAAYYEKIFFEDLKKLNIGRPEIIAKATGHIPEMIAYVEKLVEKGYGYKTSDGIYFDVSKFPRYGMLSGASLEENIAGARVEVNEEKRNPADFALWKKAEKNHIMQWPSPWGQGFPGWHIECSAMSRKYLGEVFDVHSGGVDHIPIHHENEIAQNEALSGKKTVNFWMHGEFMLVDGGKMSKSLKNTYTISELEERGYSALDFRFFCLSAHYRKKLNFTFEGLDGAKSARRRLLEELARHRGSDFGTPAEILEKYRASFKEAIEDDLNVSLALGVLFTAVKEKKSRDIYDLALEFDKIFGLSLESLPETKDEGPIDIPAEISALIEKRNALKAQKDFAGADKIRAEILEKGYKVIDTKEGYKIIKASSIV